MPASASLPLWRGRTLALLGILLVAWNLRSAVAALSPIFAEIRTDFPLGDLDVGVLGMLPPICFAVFGMLTPVVTRRLSLELVLLIALAVMVAGHLIRAVAGSFLALSVGSVVVFAGMAVGNVLLPPLVKRYFPDRIGLLTSLYATMLSLSTLLPPLVAVPVADTAGWRVSVGMWAVIAVIAILPWLGVLIRRKPTLTEGDADAPAGEVRGRVWRSPIAWALMVVFSMSSLNVYTLFAWLPDLLSDTVHTSPAEAGALLSLYSGMGLPTGLLIPVFAARMKNVALLVYVGVACFIIGDLGLMFAPATATWCWVVLAGLGPLLFPLALLLINERTRTHEGSVALSGFVQGIGYLIAAIGPVVFGALHELLGGWVWSLAFLVLGALAAAVAGAIVARPHMLEDDWHRGPARKAPVGEPG